MTRGRLTAIASSVALRLYRMVPIPVSVRLWLQDWLFAAYPKRFSRTEAYKAWLLAKQLEAPHHALRRLDKWHGSAGELVQARFPDLRPMPVFSAPAPPRRVTMLTDSINQECLYDGLGTAMILATMLARRMEAALRIVTRIERARQGNLRRILDVHGIAWRDNVEFAFADYRDPRNSLAIGPGDLFLTTSWRATQSLGEAVGRRDIVYLLQEDERMSYPLNDDHLRCSELLADPKLRFIVNSRLLFDHLVAEGFSNIRNNGVWFEPAFPPSRYFMEEKGPDEKLKLLFYARPNHPRNLFYRGLEALDHCLQERIISADDWDVSFIGEAVGDLSLGDTIRLPVLQSLEWNDYCAPIRRADLALTLMYSPHPGYPLLDLAASGSVVVTNRFGNKVSLDGYSRNIICADPSTADLVRAVTEGVALARDRARRQKNYLESGLQRDWETALEPCLRAICGG